MNKISVLGVDLGQSCFYVHGADGEGREVLRKKLTRAKFIEFMARVEPCVVGMEACRGAHHWGRSLTQHGHTVRLIAPRDVKAYVRTNKNDWNDAEAICEAVCRPRMRFVGVKSVEQQAMQMLHGARQGAIKSRTSVSNQLRAHLHEVGIVVAPGREALRRRAPGLIEGLVGAVPGIVVQVLEELYEELRRLDERIERYDREVKAQAQADALSELLMTIPGVGPLSATALVAKVGRGEEFVNGRHLAAWIGLVPRHSGTGGRTHLFGISKRGDSYLRMLLVHGARSVLQAWQGQERADGRCRWVLELAERRGHNVACVALANKMARTAWAMLRSGEVYRAAPV